MEDRRTGSEPGVAAGLQAAGDTTGDIGVIPPAASSESPARSAGSPEGSPEKLPSGKWLQRVPRTLHRDLIRLAERERVSLNQLVTALLSEAVGARKPKVRTDGHGGMLRPRRV